MPNAPHEHAAPQGRPVALVTAPASLSNLGPGFDALGLAVEGLGDVVEVWTDDEPGVRVARSDTGAAWTPPDAARNTAAVAAQHVLGTAGAAFGLTLRIRKGLTPGSGLGSSAASAVAGAWAANVACGEPLGKADLVEAVLAGEAVASGARHGDNVLPSLWGGAVLVSPSEPTRYRPVTLGCELHIALVVPHVEVLTRDARAILPEHVPLRGAVGNAAELAFLIDALVRGDVEAAGRSIERDTLVEPLRARLVPCYRSVREAARQAGALGCALSGSGPTLFALCLDAPSAQHVAQAMREASEADGIAAGAHAVRACRQGATTLSQSLS
jgi:homoserine kinase